MDSLSRFRIAQERTYLRALTELRAGCKRSHWMWFIFPQVIGLGISETSRVYGVLGIEEARQYLNDPVLGARLRECVATALEHSSSTPREIFGDPDDLKFRSCLTLFELADPGEQLFSEALSTFYDGARDTKTIDLLGTQ